MKADVSLIARGASPDAVEKSERSAEEVHEGVGRVDGDVTGYLEVNDVVVGVAVAEAKARRVEMIGDHSLEVEEDGTGRERSQDKVVADPGRNLLGGYSSDADSCSVRVAGPVQDASRVFRKVHRASGTDHTGQAGEASDVREGNGGGPGSTRWEGVHTGMVRVGNRILDTPLGRTWIGYGRVWVLPLTRLRWTCASTSCCALRASAHDRDGRLTRRTSRIFPDSDLQSLFCKRL